MKPVRCPKCDKLLGVFRGKGEIVCPRCRKGLKVYFDTYENRVEYTQPEQK